MRHCVANPSYCFLRGLLEALAKAPQAPSPRHAEVIRLLITRASFQGPQGLGTTPSISSRPFLPSVCSPAAAACATH